MAKSKLKSSDLLLLMLYTPGRAKEINEPIAGRTRLTKMVFVFEKECYGLFKKDKSILDKDDLPEFFAWKFGPMSKEVLEDLEFFIKIHFIKYDENKNSLAFEEADEYTALIDDSSLGESSEDEYIEYKYSLTSLGLNYMKEKIIPIVTENQINIITELKKRFNQINLNEIINYVYSKYPDYTEKSIIKSKVKSC